MELAYATPYVEEIQSMDDVTVEFGAAINLVAVINVVAVIAIAVAGALAIYLN